MNVKNFALGVAAGFAAAVVAKEVTKRTVPYAKPDSILETVKSEFKKQAPIDGSWIYMKTEKFNNGLTDIPVFKGGITRTIEGEVENYEFAADARSGAIVSVAQVN